MNLALRKFKVKVLLPDMTIELKKFGNMLISRPAGKEALLVARAYTLPKDASEPIAFDFLGVDVLAPSWADEFLTPLLDLLGKRLILMPTDNLSVHATLKILQEANKKSYGS